jgi:hypothetical protein
MQRHRDRAEYTLWEAALRPNVLYVSKNGPKKFGRKAASYSAFIRRLLKPGRA